MATSEMDYMNIGMGNLIGVDTNNVVYNFTDEATSSSYDLDYWVATEDCIVAGTLRHNSTEQTNNVAHVTVEGVIVAALGCFIGGPADSYGGVCVPVKKGQTVKVQTRKGQIAQVKAYKPLY